MKKYDTPSGPVEAETLQERVEWAGTLELPDAPDFVSRPSRVSLDRMILLMEQYRRWFPPSDAVIAERAKRKCGVEFIL